MRSVWPKGLRARLIFGVLLASVPAFVTLVRTFDAEREAANNQALRETWRVATAVAREHAALIDAGRELLAALAQVPAIREGRGSACNALLADIKGKASPRYSNFAVIRPSGDIECSALPVGRKVNVADASFFREAVTTGAFVAGRYQAAPVAGRASLALAYPAAGDGGVEAVVYASLDLSWLEQHPQWRSLPEGAALLLLDNDGRVILRAPYRGDWIGRSVAGGEIGRKALVEGGQPTFTATGLDGVRRVFGHALLAEEGATQGHVLVSVPEATVVAATNERRLQGLAGLAATLLLIVAFGWAATEFLVLRGLRPIMSAVRSIAAGKLSARTGLAAGGDEIRQVAQAVDAMAATLEQQREQARDAEEARRDSEARLQAIFDGITDAAVFTDVTRHIRLVNPAFTRIFGYAAEEVLGRSTEFLYADPADFVEDGVRRFHPGAGPAASLLERCYRRKDGSQFWAESVGVGIVAADGVAIGYLNLMRDISARRWAEQALRESEARLRQAARVARFGIFEHDHVNDTVQVSPEMRDIDGSSPADEPSFAGIVGAVHPEDRERVAAAIRRAHDPAGDGMYAVERRLVRPDGQVRWVSVRAQTFFDGEGAARHPVRTIGAVLDITERKRAEERFRRVVEAAPNAIVLTDARGRIALVNVQVEKLFGYARAELLGQPVEILLPQRFRGGHDGLREAFSANPVSRTMGEGRDLAGLHKDGHEIPLEIGLSPIQTEEGLFIMAFIADITRRKEAEEAVLRLNAELERRVEERTAELVAANRELDSFAYAVSHDLRGPLRAMSGFSQALLEDYADTLTEDARLYLDQIIVASRRMGDLIEGLLALSRSTRGELRRERIDLSAMAERLLAELGRLEPARRVAIDVEPGLVAWGDPRMIEAVLGNLLDNAWKYSSDRGEAHIGVRGRREGEQTWICVSDNGAGFDMAYAAKLFQPFQRLHRQDEFPGLGVGLATAQRIVHRHGGEIRATAAPGEGATFCFFLPAEDGFAENTPERE